MSGLRTIKRGGARFYVSPDNGHKAPGVTSILDMGPKPFLGPWNAKMVAEEAVTQIGPVVGLIAAGNHQAAVDMLKGAARRSTQEAANLGSDAHDLFERLARGEDVSERAVHKDLRPFRAHFIEFLDVVQPEFLFLEETVWSDTHDYAGSFDAIAKIGGETVVCDWKTTRSGVHPEVALQLKAYARADYIIRAVDGEKVDIPHIDASAVLHVRPEGWGLWAIDFSEDLFDDYFLALRRTFDWDRERKSGVVGDKVFGGGQEQTGTARREA